MKNLEVEYKNSEQEEMPDLWNRIEAGLTEKKKPIPFLSATRYLGVAAAAAVLFLLVSLGLWSGRRSTEKSAPDQALQYDASFENAGATSHDGADVEAERIESYEMEEGAMEQITDQNSQLSPPMMDDTADEASPQEMILGSQEVNDSQNGIESLISENTEAKDEMQLSAEDALNLLDSYLLETGVLPEGRVLYRTGEDKNPGYVWKGISAESGKPVLMFLEFYAYSEDGSYLIFRMGERASEKDADVLLQEYTVHAMTGTIEEQ